MDWDHVAEKISEGARRFWEYYNHFWIFNECKTPFPAIFLNQNLNFEAIRYMIIMEIWGNHVEITRLSQTIAYEITTSHLNNCWNGEGRKSFEFSNFGVLNNRIWGTKKIYLG